MALVVPDQAPLPWDTVTGSRVVVVRAVDVLEVGGPSSDRHRIPFGFSRALRRTPPNVAAHRTLSARSVAHLHVEDPRPGLPSLGPEQHDVPPGGTWDRTPRAPPHHRRCAVVSARRPFPVGR